MCKFKNADLNANKTKINEIIEMLMCQADEKLRNHVEMLTYEIENGKVVNEDMAIEFVSLLQPEARWSKIETDSVVDSQGLPVDKILFYCYMNKIYSDYYNVFGDDTDTYVKMTIAKLNDRDAYKDMYYEEIKNFIKNKK